MSFSEKKTSFPLISIQILNWNRAEETQRAIQSALEQTYPNIEIVVVDNGSTDHSVTLTRQNYPEIKLVELDQNYGCPGGRNRGIPYCHGAYIFYLDNDGILHQQAVMNAYNQIRKRPDIALVTGVVYDFKEIHEVNTRIKPRSDNHYPFYNFLGGVCLHKKSIYKITGLYPDHFIYGGEEWFLTCKVIDAGLKITKDEAVILWHKESPNARNKQAETLHAYYNRLYVAISLYPFVYMVLFGIYFPFRYYLYAQTNKLGNTFLKSLFSRYPKTLIKGIKNRKPVKTSTYRKLQNNKTLK